MNGSTNTEDKPTAGALAAAIANGPDDERLLDHHLEELLGALSAASRLALQEPPDASG